MIITTNKSNRFTFMRVLTPHSSTLPNTIYNTNRIIHYCIDNSKQYSKVTNIITIKSYLRYTAPIMDRSS
ncbi:hypothetical protein BDF19DRAFT_442157 [Syncephalis fuscata]|nr:hypothetical protein BDF19DRAFT_442157 [Syncephalis fuscata]